MREQEQRGSSIQDGRAQRDDRILQSRLVGPGAIESGSEPAQSPFGPNEKVFAKAREGNESSPQVILGAIQPAPTAVPLP